MTMGLLLLMVIELRSQPGEPEPEIKSIPMEITFNKTSSLVFPHAIKSVDRGSKDILVQKAKGVSNILQVKAGRTHFPETNLTVITDDGKLHQFTLNYSEDPQAYTLEIRDVGKQSPALIFSKGVTETELDQAAESIIGTKKSVHFLNGKKYKMQLALEGVYVKNDILFFRIRIENKSNLTYDIESFRLYIRDKSKMKRTASQELEVKPVHTYGYTARVEDNSYATVIYACEKFTIPDAKLLTIEMTEHNGGRHFNLFVKNKTIVNARLLP